MSVTLTSPKSEKDLEKYFDLRWRILRKPWNQPKGSEKDDMEEQSYHVMAVDDQHNIIGCGRLHFISDSHAQIRYMAVSPEYGKQGIGKKLLEQLEAYAIQNGAKDITLHARENAVGFYLKAGYSLIEKSHLLFDCIQHFKMNRHFS